MSTTPEIEHTPPTILPAAKKERKNKLKAGASLSHTEPWSQPIAEYIYFKNRLQETTVQPPSAGKHETCAKRGKHLRKTWHRRQARETRVREVMQSPVILTNLREY